MMTLIKHTELLLYLLCAVISILLGIASLLNISEDDKPTKPLDQI